MPQIINDPGCVVVNANTGMPDCPFVPDKIVGIILFDKDYVFAAADVLTVSAFITKLQALAIIVGQDRIYPIFRLELSSDNSSEESVSTTAYGTKKTTQDGKYEFTFDSIRGGMALHKKLRLYNKVNKKCLLVDDSGTVYGTYNASGSFVPLSIDDFYAKPWKFHDGANQAKFMVKLALAKAKELNENLAYIKTNLDIEETVKGIIDVNVEKVTATQTTITVKLYTKDDRIDLYDTYSASLTATAWVVKNAAGGTVASTVAPVAGTKAWALTGTYTTGIGPFTVQLASVTILAGLGMGSTSIGNGYESDILTTATA